MASATIDLNGRAHVAISATDGTFDATAPAGDYRLRVSAPGYATTTVVSITIGEGSQFDIALERLDSAMPREIGRVSVDGRLALARGAVPETTITRGDLERAGATNVLDALALVPSATIARPGGGAASGVSVVALRGPDPSETLVSIDGQVLNDTATGDFDFAQIPLGPFSRIDVSEGLGSTDHLAASTIGGAIDLRTLEPTRAPAERVRIGYGSFDTSSFAAESSGTRGKFGYALSGTSATSAGYVRNFAAAFANPTPGAPAIALRLGSATRAQSALANLRYDLTDRASVRVRYLTLANARDVSAAENAPVDGSDGATTARFSGPGAATKTKGLRALLVSARAPLGAGQVQASYASSGATTTYDGGASIPYDVSSNDRLATFSLAYEREAPTFGYAFGAYTRAESLDEGAGFFGRVQRQRSDAVSARGSLELGRLRVSASAFDTRYTTFGSSLDGRLGASYDLDPKSALRASIGTGFRAPLLSERFVVPQDALQAGLPGSVDANCVAQNGNANERAEHVTAYELGYGRSIDARTTADLSLYRTNLRDPIEIAYPLGSTCPASGPAVVGVALPTNVGNVIYRGAALRIVHVGRRISVRAAYGLNAAYPFALPPTVSNPTSGGALVNNQQFLSIPLQTATIALGGRFGVTHADLQAIYKGRNNELNDGPFALLNGAVGIARGRVDLTVSVRNITSAESGRFTRLGLGLPYPSPFGAHGSLPTDRASLEPISATVMLTLK